MTLKLSLVFKISILIFILLGRREEAGISLVVFFPLFHSDWIFFFFELSNP